MLFAVHLVWSLEGSAQCINIPEHYRQRVRTKWAEKLHIFSFFACFFD
jgi:hypothetical protein